MKYKIDKVEKRSDNRARVQVTVTHENGIVEVLQRDFFVPDPAPVYNNLGFRLANDGKYYPPQKKVGGEWIENDPPVEGWASNLTIEERVAGEVDQTLGLHVKHAEYVKGVGKLGEFERHGIRIVPIQDVFLHPQRAIVELHIQAFDATTGEQLDVGDGILQYNNPPRKKDGVDNPKERFKDEIGNTVARIVGRIQ